MRILQTLNWTQFAGTEKVCVDLCNEMSKNHEVTLISNKDITRYLDKNVKFINFDFNKSRYNLIFLYQTSKFIKMLSPDIIHSHNGKELEIMSYMQIFLKKKIPLVATRHNAVLKSRFALADLGIAVSKETMDYMNSKKNILITNGVSKKEPKLIKNDKFTIVGVGRLTPVKGWDLLITALSNVKFDFELQILGEGKEKENLVNLAKELSVEDKVKFVGFVDNVADYVYSSDLQVIASSVEGLSLSLIEATFYAKVLIASNIANQKEIVGSELVFDRNAEILTKKLNDVYYNYGNYVEIFAKIKAKKDDFSIEKMSEKYLKAYENLILNFKNS